MGKRTRMGRIPFRGKGDIGTELHPGKPMSPEMDQKQSAKEKVDIGKVKKVMRENPKSNKSGWYNAGGTR